MATKTKPQNIDEYIAQFPENAQERCRELLLCLRKAAPEAQEGLKWGNPSFTQKRVLFAFAVYTNHINFYPTPAVVETYKDELAGYKTTSGSLQLPFDTPIPEELVYKLAIYRLKEVLEKDAKWM